MEYMKISNFVFDRKFPDGYGNYSKTHSAAHSTVFLCWLRSSKKAIQMRSILNRY